MPDDNNRSLRKFKNRRPDSSKKFQDFLMYIRFNEEKRKKYMQRQLKANYELWAERYQFLKSEFSEVWNFFQEIERQTEDWHCVSPTSAKWGPVGHGKTFGYNFSACIMKNHDRNAPLSEKSLRVTFAVEAWGGGIGDETLIGREQEMTDELVGITNCTSKPLEQQYQASKKLAAKVNRHTLLFRLNHKTIGQESTRVGIEILEQYSLRDLCENLFVVLNNDLAVDLKKELSGNKTKLIKQS